MSTKKIFTGSICGAVFLRLKAELNNINTPIALSFSWLVLSLTSHCEDSPVVDTTLILLGLEQWSSSIS